MTMTTPCTEVASYEVASDASPTYHTVNSKKMEPSLTTVARLTLGSNSSVTRSSTLVGCLEACGTALKHTNSMTCHDMHLRVGIKMCTVGQPIDRTHSEYQYWSTWT